MCNTTTLICLNVLVWFFWSHIHGRTKRTASSYRRNRFRCHRRPRWPLLKNTRQTETLMENTACIKFTLDDFHIIYQSHYYHQLSSLVLIKPGKQSLWPAPVLFTPSSLLLSFKASLFLCRLSFQGRSKVRPFLSAPVSAPSNIQQPTPPFLLSSPHLSCPSADWPETDRRERGSRGPLCPSIKRASSIAAVKIKAV